MTGIGGARARDDELTGLVISAGTFGLTEADAIAILTEVNDATRDWRAVAAKHGIGASERDRFEPAFDGLREPIASLGAAGSGARASTRVRDAQGRFARPESSDH